MVFFVCEGCNETLKKNQVDKHAHTCRNCYAVTCVDCSVTFYENDYAAHITCISEAEKYEKSLYKAKPGANKPKAQDIWTSLIEDIVNESNQAPPSVRPFLERLSALSNVPRNKKKFINFCRNSLNIRSDGILEELWNFLDKIRIQKEGVVDAPSSSVVTAAVDSIQHLPATETEESPKKSKKDKKRSREDVEEAAVSSKKAKVDEIITDDVDGEEKQKKKKDKKKKDKKEKKSKAD